MLCSKSSVMALEMFVKEISIEEFGISDGSYNLINGFLSVEQLVPTILSGINSQHTPANAPQKAPKI